MSTWIFFQNYGTMLQAWVVSQSAFNYKTSTLMVSFLVYLSGLDTWASTEGMRGVEGRFHSYEKLKHPNNISCYHYGEWLQTCPRIFTAASHCKRPNLSIPDNLLHRHNAAAVTLPLEGTAGAPLWVCPFLAWYHFIKGQSLRGHAEPGAAALISSQPEPQPLPLSCTMFPFPSPKAAPHKTINLLTISVTLHCPQYTKE